MCVDHEDGDEDAAQRSQEVQQQLTWRPQQHWRADQTAVQEGQQSQSQIHDSVHRIRHGVPGARQRRQTVLRADEDDVDHSVDEIQDEAERDADAFARLSQDAARWNQPAVQHVFSSPRHVTREVSHHLETLKHASQRLQPALQGVQGSVGGAGDGLRGGEEGEKSKVTIFSQAGAAQAEQRAVKGNANAGQEAKQPAERPDEEVEQQAAGVQTSPDSKRHQVHFIHIKLERRKSHKS